MTEDPEAGAVYGSGMPFDWQVRMHFESGTPGTPSDIARTLIALFRSAEPIGPQTRELLASALERSLDGESQDLINHDGRLMPRLRVEGLGRDGRVFGAIQERRKWLDAAEALAERRSQGLKGSKAIEAVGGDFGLGFEVMRKAIKLRNSFQREIENPESEIVAETLNWWGENEFDQNNEDHYYFARSLFIDRHAEMSVK